VLGPAAAGAFALADRLTQAASGVIGPVITAIYPFVCRISGRVETPEDSHTKRTFFQGVVVLAAINSAILFTCAPMLISFIGGEEFGDAVVVLRVMALLPLVVALSNILGIQTMLPLHMDRQVTAILTTAAILGVAGIFISSPLFGLIGAGLTVLAV